MRGSVRQTSYTTGTSCGMEACKTCGGGFTWNISTHMGLTKEAFGGWQTTSLWPQIEARWKKIVHVARSTKLDVVSMSCSVQNHTVQLQPITLLHANLNPWIFHSTKHPPLRMNTQPSPPTGNENHARVTTWPSEATAFSPFRLAPQPRNLLRDATPYTHCCYCATLNLCNSNARATILCTPLALLESSKLYYQHSTRRLLH